MRPRLVVPPHATVADYPAVAAQLHPGDGPASAVSARSRTPRRWVCPVAGDHQWTAPPYRRIAAGAGCPACTGKQPSTTNSLASLHPSLAAELDPHSPATGALTADQLIAGTHRKVGWVCGVCGHRWVATVGSRTGRQRAGCPACADQVPTVARNLATLRPDIATQWHPTRNNGLRPDQVLPGSTRVVWWRCAVHADHEWRTSPNARTRPTNPTGCPACGGYQLSATNNLAARFPALAAQLDPDLNFGRTPDLVLAGTEEVVTWRCPAGPDHVWQSPVVTRTAGGNGCPMCANRRVSVTNMLALRPDLAAEFDLDANAPHTPATLSQSSRVRVTWRCPRGPDHVWETTVANRARAGHGCPYCAGNAVSVTNSLATVCPAVARELDPDVNDGLTAHLVTAGSNRRVTWTCSADPAHRWVTTVASRVRAVTGGNGLCPHCYPSRTGSSLRQQALASALTHALPGLTVDGRPAAILASGQPRHVDIAVPALRLILEYDGVFYHRARHDQDAAKANALRDAGWTVVRLREHGLEPLHPHDLPVEGFEPAHADRLLPPLLDHLARILTAAQARLLRESRAEASRRGFEVWVWVPPPPRFLTGLEALTGYVARHGHTRVPADQQEDGFGLGQWVARQRRLHRQGRIPDRNAQLLEGVPGWFWDWGGHRWDLFLEALRGYADREGHTQVPQSHREGGFALGAKVAGVRQLYRTGKLPADRAAQVSRLPGWVWTFTPSPGGVEQTADGRRATQ